MALTVERTGDAAELVAWAGPWLARDAVLGTVVTTTLTRALAHPDDMPGHPRWWAVVRDGGEVVGAVMRTAPFAPYPLYLLPMPDDAARAVAADLHARDEEVHGVNGAAPAGEVLARELARLRGGRVEVLERTRLFVLDDLGSLVEPATPPGGLRRASYDDLALVTEWYRDFVPAAAAQAGHEPSHDGVHVTEEEVAVRIADGAVWLWERDGERVHLTHASPASFGVSRLGPVYTPTAHRGRGYAGAAVAAVTRTILEAGDRACLFTDQANPVTNRLYPAMGYRAVTDMAHLRIADPAPPHR